MGEGMSPKGIEQVLGLGELPVVLEQKIVNCRSHHEELLHWQDNVEIILVREGTVHCHINGTDFLLNPGELCFVNFNVLHRIYNTGDSDGVMQVLKVKPDMLADNKEIYEKYIIPVIHNQDFSHIRMDGRHSYAKLISDLFDSIYELISEKPTGYELDAIAYIYMLFRRLYLVYRAQEDVPVSYTSDTSLQRRMAAYIYEHYQEKISLDDIAGAAGVSRSKCASLFRKYTQKTPISFLNSYRLEMASMLLVSTDDPISYIAQACGIGEQSYFNRLFLREFDCTPMERRRQRRSEIEKDDRA